MGIYSQRDIGSTFSGDIKISTKGDLELATAYDTQVSLANFWVRTDNADYAADTSVGANIGEYVGETNSREVLQDMEDQTYDSLIKNLFFPEDVAVKAVPFDINEAMVAVQIAGNYSNGSGQYEQATPQVFTYMFPYYEGKLNPSEIT